MQRATQAVYEELLALRCRRGEKAALEELVRIWEKRLFYFIRRLVDNEADAWDVLQQTWVRALSGIGALREPRSIGPWLYRVARHAAFNHGQVRATYRQLLQDYPVRAVLVLYIVATTVLRVVMAIVFQLAHAVEPAAFPVPRPDTGRIVNSWAVHQVETKVDFARKSRLVSWLLGGLNFQIEHHLFPRICHVNYPGMSKVVEATCKEFGVKYAEHESVWAGVASHYRWLRRMGRPDAAGLCRCAARCLPL